MITAADKNGQEVIEGDIVKVNRKKKLYKIVRIVDVSIANEKEQPPVLELAPLETETIFREEHEIELIDEE